VVGYAFFAERVAGIFGNKKYNFGKLLPFEESEQKEKKLLTNIKKLILPGNNVMLDQRLKNAR
jgi:hypothetical protein